MWISWLQVCGLCGSGTVATSLVLCCLIVIHQGAVPEVAPSNGKQREEKFGPGGGHKVPPGIQGVVPQSSAACWSSRWSRTKRQLHVEVHRCQILRLPMTRIAENEEEEEEEKKKSKKTTEDEDNPSS